MTELQNRSSEIAKIIQDWQEYLSAQRNYSQNTTLSYRNDLEHFLNFIGKYQEQIISLQTLENIDLRLIRSWLSERHQNDYKAASNARALSAIKNFYKYLEKKYGTKCHAIFTVKNPKKPSALPKALSKEETNLSLDKIEMLGEEEWLHLRNKALLALIYASGMRISEALSITKNHLKNQEFIKITGKGSKERLIPWISSAKSLVEKYVANLPYDIEPDEPIFRGQRGGPLQRAVFNKELMVLRRMLGLPEYLSSHAFRHSFATHLMENGANLRSIQNLLGHKSLSSTQRYTKINQTHLESIYNKTHPESK